MKSDIMADFGPKSNINIGLVLLNESLECFIEKSFHKILNSCSPSWNKTCV